ncbi:MAG: MBL fold metallo-hydrolase [Pseudomonadales bacterium]
MANFNIRWVFTALAFTAFGVVIGHYFGQGIVELGSQAKRSAVHSIAAATDLNARTAVILEYPELLSAIRSKGTVAEGRSAPEISQNMFSRTSLEAIEAVREVINVEKVADRIWFIRLGPSNTTVFETDAGLVVVDSGVGPAGPALVETLKSISDKPLHTLIYTHAHVDHAYGSWALIEAGWDPEIIAHENLPARVERYIRLGGSIAKYMSQPVEQIPKSTSDFVWPTRLFKDELELTVGGEKFILRHHLGETDDQFYVWVPGHEVLLSAEYYQDRIPNVGNGKRVTRYVEEWAVALREMASLNPKILLPSHGPARMGAAVIKADLLVLAQALEYINNYTIDALNKGLRKDQIFQGAHLPPELASHPRLQEGYVSIKDVSKMILKRYTGWWDDIPSHWSPAAWEEQARLVVKMAGGVKNLDVRARELMSTHPALASHVADWAFYGAPDNAVAQQLVLDVYKERILDPGTYTQESLAYLDFMAQVKRRQMAR